MSKTFELEHIDQLADHVGKNKTNANIKRFFFWPGMYKWITQLIAGCLDCQKNEHKRHDLNQAPLEHARIQNFFRFIPHKKIIEDEKMLHQT